jgi:hypothetical protein
MFVAWTYVFGFACKGKYSGTIVPKYMRLFSACAFTRHFALYGGAWSSYARI